VAAATVLATGMVALGVCAAPAQAAAPTSTTAVTHVILADRPGPASLGTIPRTAAHAGAAQPVPATHGGAADDAAAAAAAGDSSARSRLWHQTLAEFGILAAAFAVLARRSFRPLINRRARTDDES
jgi:hypothetical protein